LSGSAAWLSVLGARGDDVDAVVMVFDFFSVAVV